MNIGEIMVKNTWIKCILIVLFCQFVLWGAVNNIFAYKFPIASALNRKDIDIVVIYKKRNGKLYQRQYDRLTGEWLTDWILVG